MARIIATISGGKASGYVAHWALQHYAKDDVVLYFNDTGWGHPDLYRFLRDLSTHLNHPITEDSDGRDVELLAYDEHAIPNNRMPFCSVQLKAERLQKYCLDGDVLLFGIGADELHRAARIAEVYAEVARRRRINLGIRFPLIEERISSATIDQFYSDNGIEIPALYRLGFKHNNCGGGCVRSSKRQWVHLLRVQPETFAERERFEMEIGEHFGKRMTMMKNISLQELRLAVEAQTEMVFPNEPDVTDCIGVCNTMA
jgi:3'-phosphoadenosine 5'-phosphosulfate sulfotransferase (PAPS reductase)/FAD synthetase